MAARTSADSPGQTAALTSAGNVGQSAKSPPGPPSACESVRGGAAPLFAPPGPGICVSFGESWGSSDPVGVIIFNLSPCSTDGSSLMHSSPLAHAHRQRAADRGRAQIEENRRQRRELWLAEACSLWKQWRHDPLFILGVGLYWGEGRKCQSPPRLSLTNSDVHLLQVWLRWCQRFLPGVPLYYELHIHDNCAVEAAKLFWKQQLSIEVQTILVAVSSASNRRRNTLSAGTLTVRVGRGSVEWLTKMFVWLELTQLL